MSAGEFQVWDLDPAEYPDEVARGWSGPYPAQRAEVVSAGGRAILVAHVLRGGTPRVVRCRRGAEGAWVIHRRIAEDVEGREGEAFAEMLGYARADLECQVAEDAARAAARRDGCACDGPTAPAPPPPGVRCLDSDDECESPAERVERFGLLRNPFGAAPRLSQRIEPGTTCTAGAA